MAEAYRKHKRARVGFYFTTKYKYMVVKKNIDFASFVLYANRVFSFTQCTTAIFINDNQYLARSNFTCNWNSLRNLFKMFRIFSKNNYFSLPKLIVLNCIKSKKNVFLFFFTTQIFYISPRHISRCF